MKRAAKASYFLFIFFVLCLLMKAASSQAAQPCPWSLWNYNMESWAFFSFFTETHFHTGEISYAAQDSEGDGCHRNRTSRGPFLQYLEKPWRKLMKMDLERGIPGWVVSTHQKSCAEPASVRLRTMILRFLSDSIRRTIHHGHLDSRPAISYTYAVWFK